MEKVMDYSNSIVLETAGLVSIEGFSLILGFFIVVISFIYVLLTLQIFNYELLIVSIPIAIIGFLAINLISLALFSFPWINASEGESERYEQAAKEWRLDYLVPYLENKQIIATDIESIQYSEEVEEERETVTYLERKYNTPVRVQLISGKTIQGWAIVEEANGQQESVTYSELEETLQFGKERETVYPNFLNLSEEQKKDNFFMNVERYEIEKGQYLIEVKTDRDFIED